VGRCQRLIAFRGGESGHRALQGSLNQEQFQARLPTDAGVLGIAELAQDANWVPCAISCNNSSPGSMPRARVTSREAEAKPHSRHSKRAGGRLNPEDYGGLMRDSWSGCESREKAAGIGIVASDRPWMGNLTTAPLPVGGRRHGISASGFHQRPTDTPKARKVRGEKPSSGSSLIASQQMPFSEFNRARSRLRSAIREEAANGQTHPLRRMPILRSEMDSTIY